jgi:hypothetical protein
VGTDDDPRGGTAETPTRRRVRWWELPVSALALAAVFGWLLPRFVDYGAVVRTIGALAPLQVVVLLLLGLTWTVVDTVVFTSVIPGLPPVVGYRGWLASNAVAGVAPTPLDLLVRYGVYTDSGVDGTAVGSGVVLSGVLTGGIRLLMPASALVVLLVQGRSVGVPPAAVWMLVGGLAVVGAGVAAALASRSVALTVGTGLARLHRATIARWWTHRPIADPARWALGFRDQLLSTLSDRWPIALSAAIASQALLFVTLLVAVRMVGVPATVVSWPQLLLAFALGTGSTLLPVLRSGVGTSELIYLLVLRATVDADVLDLVAAAAFTQRIFTWLLSIVLGSVVLVHWLLTRDRRRPPADGQEPVTAA